MDIVFATNNAHKLKEVREILGNHYRVISLEEIGFQEDIPEPYLTLEENAMEKARVIHERYGVNCFADDTGLEVNALNGAPGVLSARYAGDQCSASDNIQKLLLNLERHSDRSAQFRTVVTLILDGKSFFFEGVVEGIIKKVLSGSNGFGYDPVFQALGTSRTFADLDSKTKNKISHRALAIEKLSNYLLNEK